MEHSLHLAAKHFVQTVAPHCEKRRAPASDSGGDSTLDSGEDDDDDDDDDDNIDAGDSLSKAIALVKQVCSSVALLISHT